MRNEKAKILIIEDDPGMVQVLTTFLQKDYSIETAFNGKEGLDKSKSLIPDLILLDIMMPEMDGITVCKYIKKDPAIRHVPVIFITGQPSHEILTQCLEVGANDFLSKPIDKIELLLRVENFLKIKEFEEIRIKNDMLVCNKQVLENKNKELADALYDLKTAQAQIIQQEKMASIGQLAAGVAHEINNPIGFINSNLSTLKKYLQRMADYIQLQGEVLSQVPGPEDIAELQQKKKKMKVDVIIDDINDLINESLDGTDRMKKIVLDLKSFSRKDKSEKYSADINECLERAIGIAWNEIKYKATVDKEYGDIPPIMCFPQELGQVFMNVLINAAHAIENKGEIKVKTWAGPDDLRVSISDTGQGIAAEDIEKIFEPFFTTKEVGKGTGLGMSIAREIIKKHDGEITVESAVGQGTTFTVILPTNDTSS